MVPFTPPNEAVIKRINQQFPCRDRQIRALCTLLSPTSPTPKNIVLHGLTATGKSSICCAVLEGVDEGLGIKYTDSSGYAIVKSQECITGRHLLDRTVGEVARAVGWRGKVERCEDVGRLVVLLEKMLRSIQPKVEYDEQGNPTLKGQSEFLLVFDGIDKQRDAPHTLLPALGRLSEVIPHLTTVFIVTRPRPHFLHTANPVYIAFPAYTKSEALLILSLSPPPLSTILASSSPNKTIPHGEKEIPVPTEEQLRNLWARYLAAVWDTFASHSGRDLISFCYLALKLWPKFVAPVRAGKFLATDFQRLFISQRALFRDESILVPSIIVPQGDKAIAGTAGGVNTKALTKLPSTPPLPYASQILLLAAYLCSYIPARNDVIIFSKLFAKKRRRGASGTVKGGGARKNKNSLAQRRRIDRKLLGPQAFVIERLLAVFWCVWEEATHSREFKNSGERRKGLREFGGSADILAQIAMLSSLRLLVSTGKEELDGGRKYRVNVGWEVVRSLGRGVAVELGEWLE